MKLLLLIASVAFFGSLALASDSIDEPLQRMQQEIKQLKINDALQKNYHEKMERLERHYEEKFKSLEKNYGEKIESLEKKYDEKIGKMEQNYEKKIASLEQQVKLGKNFEPMSGKFVLRFYQLLPILKRKDTLVVNLHCLFCIYVTISS